VTQSRAKDAAARGPLGTTRKLIIQLQAKVGHDCPQCEAVTDVCRLAWRLATDHWLGHHREGCPPREEWPGVATQPQLRTEQVGDR